MDHIFAIKNFFRNDFVNLTAKSIRYFYPDAKIICLNLYINNLNEYKDKQFLQVEEVFYRQTKYNSNGRGGVANPQNSLFFSEGYNFIYEYAKHLDAKILMLSEDHFFTNGKTINEFIQNDFDIAWASWGDEKHANGSILGLNLNKNIAFPIPERLSGGVESVFYEDIISKAKNPYCFSTRNGLDYKGDGFYTNDVKEIEKALIENKII